jgi:phage shock protein C
MASVTGGPRKLMRSSVDRKLAGVCAGVAEYFDLDPTLVRVVWLLIVLCGGTGLLLYVVLWIVLPVAPLPLPPAAPTAPSAATS